jgi:hypothetical protein
MIIRDEQIEGLKVGKRQRFEEGVVAHLERAYPEEVWNISTDDLRERVHSSVEKALSYGIDIEKDVSSYVDLTFELGENFDEDPQQEWAGEILRDESLSGAEKIAKIKKILFLP